MTIALQKVTDILELFLNNESELSLSELSKLSGLNKSTINRIASFLVEKDYLRQTKKRGKYSLGMKLLDFSAVIKERLQVREMALRNLNKLKQTVKESCGLVIWNGKEATLTDLIQNYSVLRVSPYAVSKLPLHPTSSGKIFLASMPKEQIEEYFDMFGLKKYTTQTITDPTKLKKELSFVKKEGFAFDIDEHIVGVSSVGAAIKDINGSVIAASVVLGPTARLSRSKLRTMAPIVRKCARGISHSLGWKAV